MHERAGRARAGQQRPHVCVLFAKTHVDSIDIVFASAVMLAGAGQMDAACVCVADIVASATSACRCKELAIVQ